jgi:hypothetical protein
MVVTAQWRFLALGGHGHETIIRLSKGELAPGATKWDGAVAGVMASGYALLHLQYTPHSQQDGSYLRDSAGRELDSSGKYGLANFRGTSLIEIRTLTALYLATIAAATSALGLVLSVLSFLFK